MFKTAFDFQSIRALYASGDATPIDIIRLVYSRIEEDDRSGLWITLRPLEQTIELAQGLLRKSDRGLPLYGLPFSVKDNIDVVGLPTTAACPAYSYMPEKSATVVEQIEAAGGICVGKTNLDQFATGLNGTRSPYGPCGAAFDASMVSGGSSSGSGVSVALQQVAFSIGTDTGGSGRIPAGLNNIVGLKPTVGSLSTAGLVPCSRTLDCPTVFALSVDDALEVATVAQQYDPADLSLRSDAKLATFHRATVPATLKLMGPLPEQRQFFGNTEGRALYDNALAKLSELGATIDTTDFEPLLASGRMLFDGPWVADRFAAVGSFIKANREEVLPTTAVIVENGEKWTGVDVFEAMDALRLVNATTRTLLQNADALVVPTVATLYSIEQMQADPVERNNHHGYYSYWANLLDLCAISVPTGFYASGMPFGVTLLAPAFRDAELAAIARSITEQTGAPLGRPRPLS
ncbi:MAG: allophanate hydrolase [Hyphomicrobiaceae bacterium]